MAKVPRRLSSTYSVWLITLDGVGTLVDQLVRALRVEILKGEVGARLPPTRTLAEDLGVSRNTVITAYGELANEGLIVSHFGGGSFIGRQEKSAREAGASRKTSSPAAGAPGELRLTKFARRLEEWGMPLPEQLFAPRPA